jgi:hypothetical protein
MTTTPSKEREADYTKSITHIFSSFAHRSTREKERESVAALSPAQISHTHSSAHERVGLIIKSCAAVSVCGECSAIAMLGRPRVATLSDGKVHLAKIAYYPQLKTDFLEHFSASHALLPFIMVRPRPISCATRECQPMEGNTIGHMHAFLLPCALCDR